MQQRRLRLGDILDDYCTRERRITNHAVVAMIDDEVKQTRCTTCDAEHEYKQAKVPLRKKKDVAAVAAEPSSEDLRPTRSPMTDDVTDPTSPNPVAASDDAVDAEPLEEGDPLPGAEREDEGPVHRRLIRATLPRPEGQAPEWKNPEFTIRQPGGRGRDTDGNREGQRQGGRKRRSGRPGQGNSPGQPRFATGRQGDRQGSAHGQRQGGHRSSGQPGNHQPSRPGSGSHRGPGRKRGR